MRHGIMEDRKGIGTRIRAGNREGNWADNGLYALIYYFWPNSKAIRLVFCRKMTKIEIH